MFIPSCSIASHPTFLSGYKLGLGSMCAFTSNANMKTGTVFLLVVFITLGMEMVCSQRPSRGESAGGGVLPESREGSEPSFRPGVVGPRSRQCADCRVRFWHCQTHFF